MQLAEEMKTKELSFQGEVEKHAVLRNIPGGRVRIKQRTDL